MRDEAWHNLLFRLIGMAPEYQMLFAHHHKNLRRNLFHRMLRCIHGRLNGLQVQCDIFDELLQLSDQRHPVCLCDLPEMTTEIGNKSSDCNRISDTGRGTACKRL